MKGPKKFNMPGSMITSTGKSTGGGMKPKRFMSNKGLKGGSTNPMRKPFTKMMRSMPIRGMKK